MKRSYLTSYEAKWQKSVNGNKWEKSKSWQSLGTRGGPDPGVSWWQDWAAAWMGQTPRVSEASAWAWLPTTFSASRPYAGVSPRNGALLTLMPVLPDAGEDTWSPLHWSWSPGHPYGNSQLIPLMKGNHCTSHPQKNTESSLHLHFSVECIWWFLLHT